MSLVERSLIDDSCFVREMVSFVCIDSLVDLDVLMFVRGFELGDGRVRVLEIVPQLCGCTMRFPYLGEG